VLVAVVVHVQKSNTDCEPVVGSPGALGFVVRRGTRGTGTGIQLRPNWKKGTKREGAKDKELRRWRIKTVTER
jgi:hypothetical protein